MSDEEVFSSEDWFFENLDRAAAESLLIESGVDSFLVRPSTVSGSLALSIYTTTSAALRPSASRPSAAARAGIATITHTLILRTDGGDEPDDGDTVGDREGGGSSSRWRLQDSPRSYRSLNELVQRCPELAGLRPALRPPSLVVSSARASSSSSSSEFPAAAAAAPLSSSSSASPAVPSSSSSSSLRQPSAAASSPRPKESSSSSSSSRASSSTEPGATAAIRLAQLRLEQNSSSSSGNGNGGGGGRDGGKEATAAAVEGGAEESAAAAGRDELTPLLHRLLSDVNAHTIGKVKESLKLLIDDQASKIQAFDRAVVQQSLRNKAQITLPAKDGARYQRHLENVERLRSELQKLRLRGDEFRIVHKGQPKIFKISADSLIMFCQVERTTDVQRLSPDDMTQFVYFNVSVLPSESAPGTGGAGSASSSSSLSWPHSSMSSSASSRPPAGVPTVYEIVSARQAHTIDELVKVSADELASRGRGGGCCLFWKSDRKSTFFTTIADECTELIETVSTHHRRFKQAATKQIELLKDIYRCKASRYNPTLPEHEALLRRLWKALVPAIPLDSMVSPLWKTIGFQGNNPATDFRGMGLLGLLNLIYAAEHYTKKMMAMIGTRDYPWAATGINLTSLLLNMINLSEEQVMKPASSEAWQQQHVQQQQQQRQPGSNGSGGGGGSIVRLFLYNDNDDSFDELFAHVFMLFDALWTSFDDHRGAEYMDFPNVISQLQTLLDDLLKRKPLDIAQFIAWIEQTTVSYRSTNII